MLSDIETKDEGSGSSNANHDAAKKTLHDYGNVLKSFMKESYLNL